MKHVEAYKKGYYLPPVVDMSWAMADAPKKALFGAAWTYATATRPRDSHEPPREDSLLQDPRRHGGSRKLKSDFLPRQKRNMTSSAIWLTMISSLTM